MIKPVYALTGTTTSSTTTSYLSFESGFSATASSAISTVQQPVGIAGTLANLYVYFNGSPGTGTSYTITLYKNGSPTGLTVTVSDLATTGNDIINTVTVAVGDIMAWQILPTNTPTSRSISVSCTYEGTTDGELSFTGGTTALSNSVTNYQSTFGGAQQTTDVLASCVFPCDGVLDKMYLSLNASPGVGKSYTFTVYKNGSPGALTAAVSDAATTNTDNTNSITFAAGDTISIESVPANTPTARQCRFAFRFTPTVNGECPLFNRAPVLTVSAARYLSFTGAGPNGNTEIFPAVQPVDAVIKKLYRIVDPAPGSGKSWTITARKGGVSQTLTAQISDAATTANDTSNSDAMTTGELWNWVSTPAGTPTAITKIATSAVVYVAPVGGSTVKDLISSGLIAFPR